MSNPCDQTNYCCVDNYLCYNLIAQELEIFLNQIHHYATPLDCKGLWYAFNKMSTYVTALAPANDPNCGELNQCDMPTSNSPAPRSCAIMYYMHQGGFDSMQGYVDTKISSACQGWAGLKDPNMNSIYGELSQNSGSALFGNPCLFNQANTEVQTDISNLITYMTAKGTKTSPGGFEFFCATGNESTCSVNNSGLATALKNIATTINQFIKKDSVGLLDGYLYALVDYLTLAPCYGVTNGQSCDSLSSLAANDPTGQQLLPYLIQLIYPDCGATTCNAFTNFLMNLQNYEYKSVSGTCISGCDNTNNPVSNCSSPCKNTGLSCCQSS